MELLKYIQLEEEKKNKSKKQITIINKKISFIKSINIPLEIITYGEDQFSLYSKDYALATDFTIKRYNQDLGGGGSPDGTYGSRDCMLYPLFYFFLDKKFNNEPLKVLIDEKSLEHIAIKKWYESHGTKEYSDENKYHDKYVNIDKVMNYLKTKGVRDSLISKLKDKIIEIKEVS